MLNLVMLTVQCSARFLACRGDRIWRTGLLGLVK